MPQTGIWGLSFCPLTSSPAVSTHSTPADGVDSTLLVIATFSLQVSFLTLCSLWRSPSLKYTSGTLKDSSVTLETICTHLVVLWGHPACLIQESVPSLSSAFLTVSLLSLPYVVFCPCKCPRGQMGCEHPAEGSPSGPPWPLPSSFTAQFLPPGPDALLFVFCFDFGRKFVSNVAGAADTQNRPLYFSLLSSTQLAA